MGIDLVRLIRRASRTSSDRWLYAWGLGYAAVGASSLLLPLYALSLGGGPFVVGTIEATAGLAGVPGALIWGSLADRTGQRRGFVLVSLLGSAIVLAVIPFAETIGHLLLLNGILWFLVAAATPVVTLFIIEGVVESRWGARIGLLNAAQRYGWVGGLVLGAIWLWVGTALVSTVGAQRTFFFVCAIGAAIATPLSFYWLPPTATTRPARLTRSEQSVSRLVTGSGRYLKLIPHAPARAIAALRNGGQSGTGRFGTALRRYFLAAFVFSAGFATFFGPVPAFLHALGLDSAAIFGLFILASLASAMLFVPTGELTAKWHPRSLQATALGVRTVLFPAIGAVTALSGVFVLWAGLGLGFVVLGITWAVVAVTGAGLVTRSAPSAVRGEALGVFTAVSGIGGGVGGLAGGYIAMRAGYLVTFATAGVLVFIALGVFLTTRFEDE